MTTQQAAPISLPTRMGLSAVAGIGASCFCHPLDVIRVQMQIDSEGGAKRQFSGTLDAGQQIFKRGGISGLYAGLSAAWLRQLTYSATRMGVYSYLLENVQRQNDGGPLPFYQKLGLGSVAGGIAAFIGNPAELSMVRMGADAKSPPELRRNYKNVVDCLIRVVQEEGVLTLWRGSTVTILRAMTLNAFQLGLFSEIKQQFVGLGLAKDSLVTLFLGSLTSAFFAVGGSMPFDVVKSRMQNMQTDAKGVPVYSDMVDCAKKSIKSEGVLVLWRGFVPAFTKLAPYTVISFVFLEKLSILWTGRAAL